MRTSLIVFGDPVIEVGLQFVNRPVDFLAERDPIELVQDGAMEAFTDSVCLRALGFGATVVDVLDRKIELVFMALGAAELGATIGQHAAEPDAMLIVERHHAIVEDLGGSDRGFAVI